MGLRVLRQLGGASIELAFITVGVAVFITGAADITRIFQARGAVQAAVHEGLRCLYTADDGCKVEKRRGRSDPEPITFDVWTGKSSTALMLEREYVNASASWQVEPVWRVPIEESAIESVLVDTKQTAYSRYRVLYPVEAQSLFIEQMGSMPRIAGVDPLNPIFLSPVSGELMKPRKTIQLGNLRGETRAVVRLGSLEDQYYARHLKLGEVSFSIAEAWQGTETIDSLLNDLRKRNKGLRCYAERVPNARSERQLERVGKDRRRECFYNRGDNPKLFSGDILRVPLMFRISGSSLGTSARIDKPGKIVALMKWKSPSAGALSRRIGGRLLSGGSRGDFVVRGADWREIDDDSEPYFKAAGYRKEIEQHNDLGLVPLDATVTLEFFLSSADGVITAWRGGELQLFFPTFSGVREKFACGFSSDPSRCINTPPSTFNPSYFALDAAQVPRTESIGSALCSHEKPAQFEPDQAAVIERVGNLTDPPVDLEFWSLAAPGSECQSEQTRYACSAALTSLTMRGCDAPEIPRQALFQECGIPESIPESAPLIIERSEPRPVGYEIVRGCTDPPVAECSALYREEIGSSVLLPNTACAASIKMSAPREQIGPTVKDQCSQDPYRSFEAEYRARHALPAQAHVELVRSPAPELLLTQGETPQCAKAREVVVREEVQCASRVGSEGVTKCCTAAQGDCRYQQSGVHGSVDDTSDGSSDLSSAIHRTVSLVQTVFPQAAYRGQCLSEEAYCLQVSAEPSQAGKRATLSASLNVPVGLLEFFGSRDIRISFEASREGELSRIRRVY